MLFKSRRLVSSVCFAAIVLDGCANTHVQFTPVRPAKTMAAAVSRELQFSPTDASGAPVTAEHVAEAIAIAYPTSSHFPRFGMRAKDDAFTKLSVDGVTHGPVSAVGGTGIIVRASGNTVQLAYRVEWRNASGVGTSTTTATLLVVPIPEAPGRFRVTAGVVSETLGIHPGLGFISLEPIAPLHVVKTDIEHAMTIVEPRLQRRFVQRDEFESPHSVVSTFANFTRRLGDGALFKVVNQDTRHGTFTMQDGAAKRMVDVSVAPYHNHSIVTTQFAIPYELLDGGASTWGEAHGLRLSSALRAIANE